MEVWSLCPFPHSPSRHKEKLSQRAVGGHLKNMWRAISSWANFCQTSCGVASFGFPGRMWNPRNPTSGPATILPETWNRETGIQMGESFNCLSVNHGLGTECQTPPCWHHYYRFKLHEELPREEAELSADLNHIRTPGVREKSAFLV